MKLPPVAEIGGLRGHPRMALVASDALDARYRGLVADLDTAVRRAIVACGVRAEGAVSLVGSGVFDRVVGSSSDLDGSVLVGFEGPRDGAAVARFARALVEAIDAARGLRFYRLHATCLRRTLAEWAGDVWPDPLPWEGRRLWGLGELAADRIETGDGRVARLADCADRSSTLPVIISIARDGLPGSIDLSIVPVFGWPDATQLEDMPHGCVTTWFGRVCFGEPAAAAWRRLDALHQVRSGMPSAELFGRDMLVDTRKAFFKRTFLKVVKWLCKPTALAGDAAELEVLAGFLAGPEARAYAAVMTLTMLERFAEERLIADALVRSRRAAIGERLGGEVSGDGRFLDDVRDAIEAVENWESLGRDARVALGRAIVPAADASAKRFLDDNPELITRWFR